MEELKAHDTRINHKLTLDNLIADWIDEGALNQPATCTDTEAYTCEGSMNGDYVTELGGIPYDNSCSSCSSGEACDGYYGSSTECYYYFNLLHKSDPPKV